MPTTRSGKTGITPGGGKHGAVAGTSPSAKRAKTANPDMEQKTIEEIMKGIESPENDEEIKEQSKKEYGNGEHKDKQRDGDSQGVKPSKKQIKEGIQYSEQDSRHDGMQNEVKEVQGTQGIRYRQGERNAFDEVKADESEVKQLDEDEEPQKAEEIEKNHKPIAVDKTREEAVPSSILEKGIIYFFFRGRVGVEDPEGIKDIARTFIVFRPLPLGAQLGGGPLQDSGNARLIALPKKFLPQSKGDRFLAFVEKAKTTVKDLKDNFMPGSSYSTKTQGTSHIPSVTPAAEGVYIITSTGRDSHIAYEITTPEIGEVQNSLGISQRGSFIISVKNPTTSTPAGAAPSKTAEYPESIKQKFGSYRWIPLEPELLDYENAQFLMIGGNPKDFGNATQETEKDQNDEKKVEPAAEIEKLEGEDLIRVEHLKEDDPIFADLGLSSKQYSPMRSTW